MSVKNIQETSEQVCWWCGNGFDESPAHDCAKVDRDGEPMHECCKRAADRENRLVAQSEMDA